MFFLSRPGDNIPKYFHMNTVMKRSGPVNTSRSSIWALLILITIMLIMGIYWIQPSSCNEPVTYHIGSIDPRFGLSNEEVAEAISTATSIW